VTHTVFKTKAIECQQNQQNGFVRFKPKSSTGETSSVPIVPKHLQAKMPNPLQHFEKESPAADKTSRDYQAEADRLRDELAKTRAEQDAKLNALKMARARSAPPPPPSLSFGRKK